jgi:hypothetical protein
MGISNMACTSLQRLKKIKEVDIIARTAITYVSQCSAIYLHPSYPIELFARFPNKQECAMSSSNVIAATAEWTP